MSESDVRNILLVVDSSDAAVRAARKAIELAADLGAKVDAVCVVDTGTLRQLLTGKILVAEEMEEFEDDLAVGGRKYLRMVEELATDYDVPLETHLLKGSWSPAILAEAKRIDADLVVLGGFKYSMVKRDLVCKQKQTVIDDAPCPVLIVR